MTESMKALVINGPYNVEVRQLPIPVADQGSVVVKVSLSGLCGSDLHNYRGHPAPMKDVTLGHEFTGEVYSVGEGIKNLKVGDKVVSPFTVSCGTCFFCTKGRTSRCVQSKVFGSAALEGAQAQYVKVPLADSTLYKLDGLGEDLPEETLLLMADIFPTGYFVAQNAWLMLNEEERKDATCVVVGCGPVGLCAITSAKHFFKTVYAIDSVSDRLRIAKDHGAIPLHLTDDDPVSVVKKATDGRGADAVCEVVGVEKALLMSIEIVRPWGVISSCGLHTHGISLSGLDLYNKNLKFQFGRCPVRAVFKPAMDLLVQNKDLFKSFIQHRVPLDKAPEYYSKFEKNLILKTAFDMKM